MTKTIISVKEKVVSSMYYRDYDRFLKSKLYSVMMNDYSMGRE